MCAGVGCWPLVLTVVVWVDDEADDELDAAEDGPAASKELKALAADCWPPAPLELPPDSSGLSLESGEFKHV